MALEILQTICLFWLLVPLIVGVSVLGVGLLVWMVLITLREYNGG